MQKNKIAFWLFFGITLSTQAYAGGKEEILGSIAQFQGEASPISTISPPDGAKTPPIGTVGTLPASPAERLIDAPVQPIGVPPQATPAIGNSAGRAVSAQ